MAEGANPVFKVTNDWPAIRRVCDELASTPKRLALETDMKACADCTGKGKVRVLSSGRNLAS